jgi:hypothetical protein
MALASLKIFPPRSYFAPDEPAIFRKLDNKNSYPN